MKSNIPRICVISATPLTMFFFFSEHLRRLSKWADVTVVYNKSCDLEVQPINAPVAVKHINIKRSISLVSDICAVFSLIFFLKRNHFDMVVTLVPKAGLIGMVAAWFCRIPIRLNIFQGEAWSIKEGASRLLLRSTATLTAICSTDLLAVSKSQRDFLINEGVTSARKLSVLGSGSIAGVDLGRFKPDKEIRAKIRNQYNVAEEDNLLLFVGRITLDKGVVHLVKSFAEVLTLEPNTFLVLVGPDEEGLTEQLKSFIRHEDQHKLIFTGFSREPESFMAAADIFCLPSRREGFGMVALEAAACELPSIGTNIYGLQDAIVHQKTGLLIPSGDIATLITALKTLIRDPALRSRFGRFGRNRVQSDFEAHLVIENYLTYFRKRVDDCYRFKS